MQVAERVGVGSMRRHMLAESADSVGLHSAEAFGQSESLTTRLKSIIDAYADGPGVLLELVSLAEADAEAASRGDATECRPAIGEAVSQTDGLTDGPGCKNRRRCRCGGSDNKRGAHCVVLAC
jgi:hypothetical protein